MIEIQNIKKIEKGPLIASCSIHIIPWCMTMHEVKIFQQGANKWVSLPCRDQINNDGTKKYIDLLSFDTDDVRNRFRAQILKAFDEYLKTNPNMDPEPVIIPDSKMPF